MSSALFFGYRVFSQRRVTARSRGRRLSTCAGLKGYTARCRLNQMEEVPTATELRRFIEELYARGTIRGEDGTEHRFLPMSVTPDRGAFIRDICRAEGGTSVLAIGMAV